MSKEAIAALLWLAASVFTVVGGVGGGLYMAYFACVGVVVIVMVYFFDAFYTTNAGLTHDWGFAIDDRPVIESVCEILQCARTHSNVGNLDNSALTSHQCMARLRQSHAYCVGLHVQLRV